MVVYTSSYTKIQLLTKLIKKDRGRRCPESHSVIVCLFQRIVSSHANDDTTVYESLKMGSRQHIKQLADQQNSQQRTLFVHDKCSGNLSPLLHACISRQKPREHM